MDTLHDIIVFVLNWITASREQRERSRYQEELRRALKEWEDAFRHAERNMMQEYAAHAKEQYNKLWAEYAKTSKEV